MAPGAIAAASQLYLTNRVEDQIKHFEEKAHKAHRAYDICHKISHYAGPAALLVVAIAFWVKADALFFNPPHIRGFLSVEEDPWGSALPLLFLPIFVPLIASLSSSFLAAFDFGRRAVRYNEMLTALKRTARKLKQPADTYPPALRHIQSIVRDTERLFLHELVEGLAAQKSGFGH